MGAPRSPLNPATQSVGFTAKLVTVQSVSPDGTTAICVDRQNTQTSVSMLVQRSKAPLPAVGETWLLAQDLGMWAFAAFVASAPAAFPGALGGSSDVTVGAQVPAAPATGELWVNTAAGNQWSEWTGLAWQPLQFGTSALADNSVTAAKIAPGTITSAQIAPNAGITAGQVAFTAGDIGGTRIFQGTAEPSGAQPGDVWYNPSAGNMLSEWDGDEWEPVLLGAEAIQPSSLTAAQLASAAGITAGQVDFTYRDIGGMAATVSDFEPPDPVVGDLWYDATNGYVLKQWNGTLWAPYQFGTNAIEAGSVTAELIAAEAVTAAKMAAGIIVAGIINGTVVEAATFIGSVFEGTNWTENADGSFLYSGTPALGNLFVSIAPVAGTDSEGNPYKEGATVYAGSAYLQMHVNTAAGAPAVEMVTGVSSEYDHPAIYAWSPNAGNTAEYEELAILGPASTYDHRQPAISLTGSAKDGSAGAAILMSNGSTTGYPAITESFTTVITNANNGTQACSEGWLIPAYDAVAGSIYEIEVPFSGTFENQTIGFKPYLNSTLTTSGGDIIGSGFLTAGAGFAGTIKLLMQVITAGTSGTAKVYLSGGIGANTIRSSGGNNNDAYLSSQNTSVSINTEVSNTLAIVSVWGGSTSGQTISANGTKFTRSGP